MAIYNTKQEERDIELLQSLGFEVINPNEEWHRESCLKDPDGTTDYFIKLLYQYADILAFRGIPTGEIPAGVYKEIQTATQKGIPIIELPVNPELRELSLVMTRDYLKEVGQR